MPIDAERPPAMGTTLWDSRSTEPLTLIFVRGNWAILSRDGRRVWRMCHTLNPFPPKAIDLTDTFSANDTVWRKTDCKRFTIIHTSDNMTTALCKDRYGRHHVIKLTELTHRDLDADTRNREAAEAAQQPKLNL